MNLGKKPFHLEYLRHGKLRRLSRKFGMFMQESVSLHMRLRPALNAERNGRLQGVKISWLEEVAPVGEFHDIDQFEALIKHMPPCE